MHIEKDAEDLANEKALKELLQLMNSSFK